MQGCEVSQLTEEAKKRMEENIWEIWIDDICGEIAMDKNDLARRKIEVVDKESFDANAEKIKGLEAENARLREVLSKDKLLEVIEEWQMIWRNQNINPEDTKRYRRRALSVDANMRYSLARMIHQKALTPGGEG